MLRLFLFGAPQIEIDSQVVPVRRTRALALLAYLARTGRPHEREALLALLWPEFDPDSARNNLRRELSLLKGALGPFAPAADRLTIAWEPPKRVWVDVSDFEERVAAWRRHHPEGGFCANCATGLEEAVQLARDDFLAGFGLPDSPAFDDWLFFQREELRQHLASVLQALIPWARDKGENAIAITHARRWLALDPLHEPAQRELMRLYAQAGQRTAALRQYDECRRLLAAELGAEPEQETTALYNAIRARQLEFSAAVAAAAQPEEVKPAQARPAESQPVASKRAVPPSPPHNLPSTSGFVGRQRDLVDLLRRLADQDCRLLTLVGPGGIGKTRLALRAGQVLADGWAGDMGESGAEERSEADAATAVQGATTRVANEVLFVPLTGVESAGGLISALADAAGLNLHHDALPRQQILDYFRHRHSLLILDNFEHMLDASEFVAALLAAAAGVRLLVTSRVALNLREEWFHPLNGLSFPNADELEEMEKSSTAALLARYDAVRLFERHARRMRGDFSLSRERAAVVRLCRLVEGMPLAIELAAGWLKLLSTEQIVAAIERGLDILIARESDTPARHRSMRAVLEETWALLSEAEQNALAALSVLTGSFDAAAAAAVADSDLGLLANLVEKALLRGEPDGRFQMHELLRQFAAARLAADSHAFESAHTRHCDSFLDFLAQRDARLSGRVVHAADLLHSRLLAFAEIDREIANVRVAWRWAVERGKLAALDSALRGHFIYHYIRGYISEGKEALELASTLRAEPAEPLTTRVRARALLRLGAFHFLLGDYGAAIRSIESGLSVGQGLEIDDDVGCGLVSLGAIAGWRGDAEVARTYLEQALACGRRVGETYLTADALFELARLNGSFGDFAESKRLAHESLALSRAAGLTDWMIRAQNALAWATSCSGEYDEAEAYFRESLDLAQGIGDSYGIGMAQDGIGWIAWCVGGERLDEAEERIQLSVAQARELGDNLALSNNLGDLALVALDRDNHGLARSYAQEGLALARAVDSAVYVAYHLCILGNVAAVHRQFDTGYRCLREAVEITWRSRLWPQLTFCLYHVAVLIVHEAAALMGGAGIEASENTGAERPHATSRAAARRVLALEWLAAIAEHPATWHVYRVRARRLVEELRGDLPPDAADAALERGGRVDWHAGISPLLAGLEPGVW